MCDATKLPASITSCDGMRTRRDAAESSHRPSLEEMEKTRTFWREVRDMTTVLSGCKGHKLIPGLGFVWRGGRRYLHDARGGQQRVSVVENWLRLARSSPEGRYYYAFCTCRRWQTATNCSVCNIVFKHGKSPRALDCLTRCQQRES